MKTIKFLSMLLAAFTLSFAFTSCGDDDDDDVDDIIEDIQHGNYSVKTDLKKSSSELVLTVDMKGVFKQVQTAKFDSNKMCKSFVIAATYANDALADAAWKELKEEADAEDYGIKRNGRTITMDMTEEYEGAPYDMILRIFEEEKAEYERMYNK